MYIFYIRYQENFTAAQPIKLQFKFDGFVPYNVIGYALIITNKVVNVSCDGQGHFNLI